MTNKTQSSYHILLCLIQIWDLEDPKQPMKESKSPLLITEVENIEIEESYRKLIGSASVKFPRGTVIKKTIVDTTGETYGSKISANINDNGVVEVVRTNTKIAEVADFKVGSRIRIALGYTDDPAVAALARSDKYGKSLFNDKAKLTEYKANIKTMFDGYITKCSIESPIELHCENLASGLKKISCRKMPPTKNVTVKDLLAEKKDGGKYELLKDTGFSLHPDTASCEINIGEIELNTDLTVADVLTKWGQYKVYAFIKYYNGEPRIAVGRSYFSNPGKDSVIRDDTSAVTPILFDYHVANNNLTLMNTDKNFLAVEATCLTKESKFYHITIRRNPKYKDEDSASSKWQILNETTISKKAQKLGATVLSKSKDKVDLSTYTVIPYMSKKIGIAKDALLEEAIKYFESYNMNGIEGSLTLFGDLKLRTGTKVELVDMRHPAKNGYYLVDEVKTSFGTHGYRQTIKLPYCISRTKPSNK